jgi:hypothetical protein
MNERIRELSEQVLSENYALPDYSMKLYSEKFAELIVKECVAIVEHFSDGNEQDQFGRTLYHYRADIGKEIEQYFLCREK